MDTTLIVLTLLLAVVVSAAVARTIRVPLPLVQIALGAVIALSTATPVELSPELFFLLFLPPLLFLDGWRISNSGLIRDRAIILELALGLVVFTVFGLGFFIHLLIPEIPLAVAFALAAVLSPTDPIAVSAIASRVPIPNRMMRILGGEALLNDATGLVCMRFAVAAAMTGTFSLSAALVTLIWVSLGGVAIGAALTFIITKTTSWLSGRHAEETGSLIIVSLLIPFGAYILAEFLNCSGILAAVAAGITMSLVEQSGQVIGATRIRRTVVWDAVQFAANGVIFVLLGQQMPGILSGAAQTVSQTGHVDPWWLAGYIVIITAVLGVLRFVWVWTSLRLTLFRVREAKALGAKATFRLITAMSLAGVRGAVTLAGVLTLPLVLNDGTPFPGRALAIFLATGVIILSLLVATLGLPRLLKGLTWPVDLVAQANEDNVRVAAAQAAIGAIEAATTGLAVEDMGAYADVAPRLIAHYRQRIAERSTGGEQRSDAAKSGEVERTLRLIGLRAEREEAFRLGRTNTAGDDIVRTIVRELDLLEIQYAAVATPLASPPTS